MNGQKNLEFWINGKAEERTRGELPLKLETIFNKKALYYCQTITNKQSFTKNDSLIINDIYLKTTFD
ncbi:hypothetical protein GCM10011325_27990 [Dyadobacter sediminis]|nr:hypothetical protein GCM10011325_27990 [Dyadobacter sediminis]